MIHLRCPGCQSKLKAKEGVAGQVRKCPKCGAALRIPQPGTPAESAGEETILPAEVVRSQNVHDVLDHELPPIQGPQRLVRLNRYLICGTSKLFATWEGNGHGWMLKTSAGFIRAKRNPDELPSQGDYTLVELKMATIDGALRLTGLMAYQLARHWALTTLDKGDSPILAKVTGPGYLTKQQKGIVQKYLHDQFMRNVWEEAHQVLDYLSNLDYHSQGAVVQPEMESRSPS